ncbi:response regulator [Bremerella cremea]|uniref:Response regulator n=1 Tax=Bremerella cremea TaxID=1031537 RepID=A0A368KT34_9BACT|nr:response regulator [Bremerella cremea]RCS46456.1 response regulator [Bremerella cremea]
MKKTVLIADDNADIVDILKRRCETLGLNVIVANNAMEALTKAEAYQPEAIMLDVNMPHGNGLSVCEMLTHHEQLSSIPVIVLTGNTSSEVVKRCHQLCAFYIPKTTDIWSQIEPVLCDLLKITPMKDTPDVNTEEDASANCVAMLDRVFSILGAEINRNTETEMECAVEEDAAPWVLTIEDDEDVAFTLRRRLQEVGINAVNANEGTEGYRHAFMSVPTAIILDYELPGGNGAYVMRRLKESPVTASIPVIVLTGRKEGYIERQMRSMGASAFYNKPIPWQQVQETLSNLVPAAFAN